MSGAEKLGLDPREVLHDLRRGGHDFREIVSTDFSDMLDASRRRWWAEEGEPDRPPHPDDARFLEHHQSGQGGYATMIDQHGTGACSTPARGYTQQEWAAMKGPERQAARDRQHAEDAEEQRAWEQRAVAEYKAQSRSDT